MRRLAISMACVIGACGDGTAPHIDEVQPDEGFAGMAVTLRGDRFCGEAGAGDDGECAAALAGSVSFGIDPLVSATVTAWEDDVIVAIVPTSVGQGDVTVVVTVDGRSSNGVTFRVR